MNKFLIIPQLSRISESLALADEYSFGFEYNDFFLPNVLDDDELIEKLAAEYHSHKLPDYCTAHGDFFDVILFSEDRLIREISRKRIIQSIETSVKFGANAVVFHTNHNPAFIAKSYVDNWLYCNESFWAETLMRYPNINIYMENMCDDSPYLLSELAARLKPYDNFGVCFDYAHAMIYGCNIEEWVNVLAPFVRHIHINDNDLMYDLHLAVGDGKIDWLQFKSFYEEYFRECTVLIETSSVENQRRSAEYLSKLGILS